MQAPTYSEGGGTRTTNYGVWDIYARAGYRFSPKGQLDLWGHYMQNSDASGPYESEDVGWGAGAVATYDKFSFTVWYKNIQANATPGFIADSDSGYVNRKGWILSAGYQIWKYCKIELSYWNTEPEDESIPGATNAFQTVFTDIIFKF